MLANNANRLVVALVAVTFIFIPGISFAAAEAGWDWTDARREGAIWSAYALNPHLSPFTFDVEVSGGQATISGVVDEDVKRDLAEEIALGIDGVDTVTNNIEVDADHTGEEEPPARTLEDTVADASATAAVKSKLLWNRDTQGLDIGVSTEDGVTTLTGIVPSEHERDVAGQIARDTRGVDDVQNELTVDTDLERPAREAVEGVAEGISDGWITTKVKSSLVFTRTVPARAIQVSTSDGIVELSGVVDSSAVRDLAIETAENVRGVQDVDATNLNVQQ